MDQPSAFVTKVLSNLGLTQAPCGCKPGREVNGWQEVRSGACIQAELDAWPRPELVRSLFIDMARGA
jgi:hypothetical protein